MAERPKQIPENIASSLHPTLPDGHALSRRMTRGRFLRNSAAFVATLAGTAVLGAEFIQKPSPTGETLTASGKGPAKSAEGRVRREVLSITNYQAFSMCIENGQLIGVINDGTQTAIGVGDPINGLNKEATISIPNTQYESIQLPHDVVSTDGTMHVIIGQTSDGHDAIQKSSNSGVSLGPVKSHGVGPNINGFITPDNMYLVGTAANLSNPNAYYYFKWNLQTDEWTQFSQSGPNVDLNTPLVNSAPNQLTNYGNNSTNVTMQTFDMNGNPETMTVAPISTLRAILPPTYEYTDPAKLVHVYTADEISTTIYDLSADLQTIQNQYHLDVGALFGDPNGKIGIGALTVSPTSQKLISIIGYAPSTMPGMYTPWGISIDRTSGAITLYRQIDTQASNSIPTFVGVQTGQNGQDIISTIVPNGPIRYLDTASIPQSGPWPIVPYLKPDPTATPTDTATELPTNTATITAVPATATLQPTVTPTFTPQPLSSPDATATATQQATASPQPPSPTETATTIPPTDSPTKVIGTPSPSPVADATPQLKYHVNIPSVADNAPLVASNPQK